ncbi:hypothetical protein LSTR_LSTR017239 [Laodelphax striatellus]|nr:hypothetical protein LSTR_LSTR017239 [Laodelphax striatellus]
MKRSGGSDYGGSRGGGGVGGRGGGGFQFAGFQLKGGPKALPPPPPTAALSKQGYSTMSSITQNALSASWGVPKKRSKTEEE